MPSDEQKKNTHRKWRLNCVLQNTSQTCKLTILTKCVDVLNRRRSGAPKYDGCFSLDRVHHGITHYVRIATYKTIDNYTQSIRPAVGPEKMVEYALSRIITTYVCVMTNLPNIWAKNNSNAQPRIIYQERVLVTGLTSSIITKGHHEQQQPFWIFLESYFCISRVRSGCFCIWLSLIQCLAVYNCDW